MKKTLIGLMAIAVATFAFIANSNTSEAAPVFASGAQTVRGCGHVVHQDVSVQDMQDNFIISTPALPAVGGLYCNTSGMCYTDCETQWELDAKAAENQLETNMGFSYMIYEIKVNQLANATCSVVSAQYPGIENDYVNQVNGHIAVYEEALEQANEDFCECVKNCEGCECE